MRLRDAVIAQQKPVAKIEFTPATGSSNPVSGSVPMGGTGSGGSR
jgi:hypothetical protein